MKNCIFCKIIRGELPSFKIYEDERVIAFLDIHPVNAGHTLIVPKAHSQNIFDIKPEDWTAVAESTRALALGISNFARSLARDVNARMDTFVFQAAFPLENRATQTRF